MQRAAGQGWRQLAAGELAAVRQWWQLLEQLLRISHMPCPSQQPIDQFERMQLGILLRQ